ncbi:MAG: beta-N-acetylhexosaminidase [Gemmatimonadaceae bacterium]
MTKRLIAIAVAALLAGCARKPTPRPTIPAPAARVRTDLPAISIIPAPRQLSELRSEGFTITAATSIVADTVSGEMRRAIASLTSVLRPATGYALPVVNAGNPVPITLPANLDTLRRNAIVIQLQTFIAPDPRGTEGYTLTVDRDTVLLTASSGAGLFNGVQTIRQLLPFGIESHQSSLKMGVWKIPAVVINDQPTYRWRGAMLDVARHFFTVDEVKQFIDILALYKLNTLHLHLADDQGWRIEIKSRPELVAMGAGSEVGGGPGGFFTQADYAEIIRYADDRYITVVPEIDMPAHINAALISHPELSCGRRPPAVYTGIQVGFSAICPDSAGTYALLDDVIREIIQMTPSRYFHIGGDEVQALNATQYATFIERVQGIVRKYGARMIGWEEIGKTRLDPTSIIQMWKSDSLTAGADLATDIIVSAAPRMYLDMKYTPQTELGLRWAGYIDIRKSYDWDPGTSLKAVALSRVIGLEAPLWSETPRNITAAQYLIMPRLPALAEVAWSPAGVRGWDSFRLRLAAHGPRWNLMGINYHRSPEIPW